MKVNRQSIMRYKCLPIWSLVAAAAVFSACGNDSSDPEVVGIDALGAGTNLQARDLGNGSVELTWYGVNYEDDFDGYNIYGMKGSAEDLGVTNGDPIVLLDEFGEVNQAAKDVLLNFNYDPAKKLEEKGTATAEAEGDDAPKFAALPIHAKSTTEEDKLLLPTCKNNGQGTCVNTTDANVGKSVEDLATIATNGPITYTLEGLTLGEDYCFFVLSSLDEGAKVAQTSTNVACITPTYYKVEFSMALPTSSTDDKTFDLTAYMTACVTNGECAAPTSTILKTEDKVHNASTAGSLFMEFRSAGRPAFIAGKNSGIKDMGERLEGFNTADLDLTPPTFTLDTNTYGGTNIPVQNGNGYSIAGQDKLLFQNRAYVIAVGDSSATNPTSFKYFWLWVEGDPTGSASSVNVHMLVPVK